MKTESNVAKHDYSLIPPDFPRVIHHGSVPGTQMKLLLVQFEGNYYTPGDTPPERFKRWENCEDIAQQFCPISLNSKAGKRSHMTEEAIIDQYLERIIPMGWMSLEEAYWTMRRTTQLLGWPVSQKIKDFFDALENTPKC
jgi:hypothetical protein